MYSPLSGLLAGTVSILRYRADVDPANRLWQSNTAGCLNAHPEPFGKRDYLLRLRESHAQSILDEFTLEDFDIYTSAKVIGSGQIVIAMGDAYVFIDLEMINNPLIYPPNEDLVNAELILPLSQKGQLLYEDIWERFSTASR